MVRRKSNPAPEPPPPVQAFEPDDAGLALDELGQAYAALLLQGSDPYEDLPTAAERQMNGPEPPPPVALADERPRRVIEAGDDDASDISPRNILEAMLFVGSPDGQPLEPKKIAALMRGVRTDEIDELVQDLNRQYDAEGAAYRIASVGAGYQLELRPSLSPVRDALYGRVREAKLAQTAVEVLAIVAYRQPITAEEVDRLRGKPSGGVLSQLVRRDLLAIERPAEKKQKPLFRTTPRFLDLFGLDDLADLPQSIEGDRDL